MAAIVNAGGIDPLLELALRGTEGQMAQAAPALRNLAKNNAANLLAIVKAGGITPLVSVIESNHSPTKVAAEAALRNLANGKEFDQAAIDDLLGESWKSPEDRG